MTHDLLKSVFSELGATISHILVNDIDDNTFFARIVVEHGSHTIEIDARPSDAIALAVRTDVPIYVETHVFERAGTTADDEDSAAIEEPAAEDQEQESDEEGLSPFREFINTLDFDDEEGKKGKQ
jgi:bifunctional DNase/RNase